MRRRHRTARNFIIFCAVLALMLVVTIITYSIIDTARKKTSSSSDSLLTITPNDLHAIHDLILVGYAAVFMRVQTVGVGEVHQAVHNLTRALPTLHPYQNCRALLAQEAMSPAATPLAEVAASSGIAWSCLPAAFTENDFTRPFTPAAVTNPQLAKQARNPGVKVTASAKLGACAASHWPRTCSYWSSIHSMALRAELLRVSGSAFLSMMVTVVASGATQCRG